MNNFEVENTIIAKRVTFPIVSSLFDPHIVADNSPGKIQFTNISIDAAFYTQINKVISINIRLTCDIVGTSFLETGTLFITPPVPNILVGQTVVGAVTTLAQIGLFGNLARQGDDITAEMVNAAGAFTSSNAVLQILGSYVIR